MPTKQQQDAINKAQLEIMGESPDTLEEVVAGIKSDHADSEFQAPDESKESKPDSD